MSYHHMQTPLQAVRANQAWYKTWLPCSGNVVPGLLTGGLQLQASVHQAYNHLPAVPTSTDISISYHCGSGAHAPEVPATILEGAQ